MFGQFLAGRLGCQIVCGERLVIVIGDDGARKITSAAAGAALQHMHSFGPARWVLMFGVALI